MFLKLFKQSLKSGTKLILLVEDDPFWQTLISGVLKKYYGDRIEINLASSVKHAETLVAVNKFDLIIFDHLLAGKETGLDMWKAFCESRQIETPMMLVSAISKAELMHSGEPTNHIPTFIEKKFFGSGEFRKLLDQHLNPDRAKVSAMEPLSLLNGMSHCG